MALPLDIPRTDAPQRCVATGWPGVDRALGSELGPDQELDQELGSSPGAPRNEGSSGLVRGAVHEWFGVGADDGNGGWSPPLFLLTHLARQAALDASDRGAPDHVVWIGRNVWPYPRALSQPVAVASFGECKRVPHLEVSVALAPTWCEQSDLDLQGPAHGFGLLARSLFVNPGRSPSGSSAGSSAGSSVKAPPGDSQRLWAIDTALRCRGVTAVVADGSGLTMAATRRLQLAAASTGVLVLLARPPTEVRAISAATTRWTVTRVSAENDRKAKLAWRLTLLRAKGAQKMTAAELPTEELGPQGSKGRRRNLPSTPSPERGSIHIHAARTGTPSSFLFDRPLSAAPPAGHAPPGRAENLMPAPDSDD